MSYIALLIYILVCGGAYWLFRFLYRNRYTSFYSTDEIIDTDESSFISYYTEDRFRPYIDNYSIYINDDYRFFRATISSNVEYINFDVICYKNKKIYKICNVLNEVRDRKEEFTIKIPDQCNEVKVRINEVNGIVFNNEELIKTDLLWRAIVSSFTCGLLSAGLIFCYRLLFNPSINGYFDWDFLFNVLFSEPYNYVFASVLAIIMTGLFFVVIYFPNLLKVKKAKYDKVKELKISKVIKCTFKPNSDKETSIIKLNIKGKKKFKTATVHAIGYDENNEVTLDKEFRVRKNKKKYFLRTAGYVDNISFKVISADFKKYYYEFGKFRLKQTKKGLEGHFLRLKGVGVASLIFALSIGVTSGSSIYEFVKIYQINNNMKHFEFEENWDGGYTLSKYNGKNNYIAIPTTYQGKNVTRVANNAFLGKGSIVEVIVPDGMEVGEAAFANCKYLKFAHFGKDVKIGTNAFYGSHLKEIEFSGNEVIGSSSFSSIPGLNRVILKGNIKIGEGAFKHSRIDYLEVHPESFNLPTSTFYGAKVKKGYIYKGSYYTSSTILSFFSKDSNVKVESSCVHDKNSFMIKDGRMIENYSYKDYQVVLEATCSSRGVKDVTCNYCGSTYRVTTKKDPNKHTYVDGVCAGCGKTDPNYKAPTEE